jgi:ferredoxin-NADP reductase
MARAALLGRLTRVRWSVAEVAEARPQTRRARTLTLAVPGWPGHRAGQHLDVRLTAEDGYRAQRAYSIASPPGSGEVAITVERLDDGEVSPWLVDVARPGDLVEVRGAVGGYFVWEARHGGPLLLIAGGSGVVPVMCIERHRREVAADVPATLLLSARSLADVIYRAELGPSAVLTLTREVPPDWSGYRRRIDRAMLAEVAPSPGARPRIYVCGPTGFVEAVAKTLVDLGHHPTQVRTERFGPTGG